MKCRSGCGACCIVISISSPLPGMPEGKPAGIRCIHLSDNNRCKLFYDPRRPQVCKQFKPCREYCGSSREEALRLLNELELKTKPEK